MPELRKDPIVGRWVIIAKERARRPGNFITETERHPNDDDQNCEFCHIQGTPVLNDNVCVITYQDAFLNTDVSFENHTHGLYDIVKGHGVHEIVIETKDHIGNMADLNDKQIRHVLDAYVIRMRVLSANPIFKYILAYKNYGITAGSTEMAHARSHIIATPVEPIRVQEKLQGAKDYFSMKEQCIYCDLMHQELAGKDRIVVETDHFVALTPFAARFLFEVLILPKNHHSEFTEGVNGVEDDLAKILRILLLKFKVGLDDPAYNYVIHTAPINQDSHSKLEWTEMDQGYHWHMEIIPRLTRIAGFEKGTGFYINSIPPEDTAEYLRGVPING